MWAGEKDLVIGSWVKGGEKGVKAQEEKLKAQGEKGVEAKGEKEDVAEGGCRSYLEELPLELLPMIYQWLPPGDKVSLMLTSKTTLLGYAAQPDPLISDVNHKYHSISNT
jgi:hypothetical protein